MLILLLCITLLGLILRLSNISPFKFFPDAYQNLIVAENIRNYHSVFGYLGSDGMLYPQFFMWTRPVYSLAINLLTVLPITPDRAAEIISLLSGVLAIPLAYFFIAKLLNSKICGLIAALIISISFNHTIWSGFIYTEPIAIFLNLLFLISFITSYKETSKLADLRDLITGVLFSLIVFTRYEYIILSVVFILLTILNNSDYKTKLINYFLGFLLTSTLFITQLYPVTDLITIISNEFSRILKLSGILVSAIIAFFLSIKVFKKQLEKKEKYFFTILLFVLWVIVLLILMHIFIGKFIPLYISLTSLRVFLFWDPFFALLIIFGITKLLTKREKNLTLLTIIPIILLWPIYNNINPEMQRYWSHLIPFLLIPASFGAELVWHFTKKQIRNWQGKIILTVITFFLIIQIITTNHGMKSWSNGSWYRESYEQKSATILNNLLTKIPENEKPILITSLPESYYFFTQVSTHSIADIYPYIYIDNRLDNRKVWVIEDMGMRDLFPNFTNSLKKNFSHTIKKTYWVNEIYRFGVRFKQEDQPVIIYEVYLKDIKRNI